MTNGAAIDLEGLRNTFVEAFNARDLETILEIVAVEVDAPTSPAWDAKRCWTSWSRSGWAIRGLP